MSLAVGCTGWAAAFVLVLALRSRLSLLADAEHELRGATTALRFAAERMRKAGATRAFASLVALQLDRMEAGFTDLERARRWAFPRRPLNLGRSTGSARGTAPDVDSGRLTQVVANLMANAVEHGRGPVQVSWRPTRTGGRLEIRNPNRPHELEDLTARRAAGRGRGVGIAQRAARALGGNLQLDADPAETVATLELPAGARAVLARDKCPPAEVPPAELPPDKCPPAELPGDKQPPTEVPPAELPRDKQPSTEVPAPELPRDKQPPAELPPAELLPDEPGPAEPSDGSSARVA